MSAATGSAEWVAILKDFTHRNAGRPTRLEIDDPELGAQWAEVDFPLRGVAYDARDGRIEIMLGEQGSLESHLTHSIEAPVALEVLYGPAGGGREVLWIRHGEGQTLLRVD
jgi:hypothetical protein